MRIVDILRKLGIFRSGTTSARYSNAKDRPLQIQQQDIFDEKKDTITRKRGRK